MGKAEYDELETMHGLIQVRFDQCAFKLTLLPEGGHNQAAQHFGSLHGRVRILHHSTCSHGLVLWGKIELLDCEYTRKSFEPYQKYMCHFEVKKNEADNKLKQAKADLDNAERLPQDGASEEVQTGLKKEIIKQNFIREQSNLFSGEPGGSKQHVSRQSSDLCD